MWTHVSRSGLPEIWGHFSEEKKSACGNVVGHPGLSEIGGHFSEKKKSACGNVVGHPGLPENPRVSRGPHFHPHPQVPRLI